MRELLFRGQTRRKGQKVWMDGTPVDSNWVEGYGVCMGKGDFSVIYAGDHVEKFTVYTDTVGQFTGLTDKNGKKIFEGDILTIAKKMDGMGTYYHPPIDYPVKVVVKWDMCALMWETIGDNRFFISFPDAWCHFECEIIGNIHDNQELLGGAEDG